MLDVQPLGLVVGFGLQIHTALPSLLPISGDVLVGRVQVEQLVARTPRGVTGSFSGSC